MKLSILNWGVGATHEVIEASQSFTGNRSISDYDAFLLDPITQVNRGLVQQVFSGRQREILELVARKGGIVVCLLRAQAGVVVQPLGDVGCYALLERAASAASLLVRDRVRGGESTRWNLRRGASGVALEYFRVLQKEVRVEGFLEASVEEVEKAGGKVLAENSASYPVAVEFVVGAGRVCFLPVPAAVGTDRVGAAIKRVVEAHFGGPSEIAAPLWVEAIGVPSAGDNDGLITRLEAERTALEAEISKLEGRRSELLEYRSLLFGYGKSVLEPIVRRALRQVGFDVPENWKGDWDFELRESALGSTAIGEVEGTEGPVDVDKYRQLLDYFQAEVLEGRTHKGILAGNGYRTKELDAPERQSQFTQHVLRGARQNGFCLLPTTELFRAVCAVLEAPADEAQKAEIRRSILGTVGPWAFTGKAATAKPAESGEAEVAAS